MADYSGDVKRWNTHFEPDNGPNYWMSTSAFDKVVTTVPKEYYQYLLDLYEEYVRRQIKKDRAAIPRAKISYNKGNWVLHGVALSESREKVETRFGWKNPCPHNEIRDNNRGYKVCLRCMEIFCEHNVQVMYKENGLESKWYCDACGKEIDE